MERKICVSLDFLEEKHRDAIEKTAAETGFVPRFFSKRERDAATAWLQESEILYTGSLTLPAKAGASLRWLAFAYAGVDPFCRPDGPLAGKDCLLTSSNTFDVTLAEHTIMVLLMLLRRMPEYEEVVRQHGWSRQLPIRSIRDNAFTILGTGNIGTNVAQRLRGMGAAKITGLSRSGRPSADFDRVLPISRLDEVLPETKILVMALPSTPETENILSRERIALLPPEAYVINVGRGTALDQDALTEALNSRRLAGAALDVMVPEPLPPDHPLWNARNLILTPHVSGNMTLGYTCDVNVDMFCRDLANYAAGRPLVNLVDRALGY